MGRFWRLGLIVLPLAFVGATQLPEAERPAAPGAVGGRFEFEIVESFDARYLGDTPGHVGRNGGLEKNRPRIALGDSVFRGELKVGTVSQVVWTVGGGAWRWSSIPSRWFGSAWGIRCGFP